jgi:hypothetical protein
MSVMSMALGARVSDIRKELKLMRLLQRRANTASRKLRRRLGAPRGTYYNWEISDTCEILPGLPRESLTTTLPNGIVVTVSRSGLGQVPWTYWNFFLKSPSGSEASPYSSKKKFREAFSRFSG